MKSIDIIMWVSGLALIVLSGMAATVFIAVGTHSYNKWNKIAAFAIAAMNVALMVAVLIALLS
jgi:succinate dehydrogenase hydrophobic anchor subunit